MNRFDIGSRTKYKGSIGTIRDKEGDEYAVEFDNEKEKYLLPGCRRIVSLHPYEEKWVIPVGKGKWVDEIYLENVD